MSITKKTGGILEDKHTFFRWTKKSPVTLQMDGIPLPSMGLVYLPTFG